MKDFKPPKKIQDVVLLTMSNDPQDAAIFLLNILLNDDWIKSTDKVVIEFTKGCVDSYRGRARVSTDSDYLNGYAHMTTTKEEYREKHSGSRRKNKGK